jgi:rhodanese-related sulfurtransferase
MKNGTAGPVLLLVLAMIFGVPEAISAVDPCENLSEGFAEWKLYKHDATRTLSASVVLQSIKNGRGTLLVDVRSAGAYAQFSIPGSINVPLHFVKTKPFLKMKPFILVDEGFRHGRLSEECRKLKDAGFSCSVLYGGLTAWRDEEGTLEGDQTVWKSLGDMPAAAFSLEKYVDGWLMIDVSQQRSDLWACLMPDAAYVKVSGAPEQAVPRLREAARLGRSDPFIRILIFNEKGTDYGSIRLLAGKAGLKNVFYLSGGLDQYIAYLSQRRLLAMPRSERLKTTAGCGSTCVGKK